jgi:hypothetical protein
MKKKQIFSLSVIAFTIVFNLGLLPGKTIGNLTLSDITVMAKADSEGGGNQATCYSTYQEPGFLQKGTMIWVCGSCVQVEAKVFSDAGICNF